MNDQDPDYVSQHNAAMKEAERLPDESPNLRAVYGNEEFARQRAIEALIEKGIKAYRNPNLAPLKAGYLIRMAIENNGFEIARKK